MNLVQFAAVIIPCLIVGFALGWNAAFRLVMKRGLKVESNKIYFDGEVIRYL
jgi:hypothetical protein